MKRIETGRMISWEKRDTWVAVYDVLGFKNLVRGADQDFPLALLTLNLSELLEWIQNEVEDFDGFEYMVISDMIILFSPDVEPISYSRILLICKQLINHFIYKQFPLRGAISIGTTFAAEDRPILIGPAFVEAYEYCEDQDWIGLLLTPSATKAIRNAGLEPLRHDFVSDEIPLRNLESENVLAYRFQGGAANFDSPLLSRLEQMRHFAPDEAKEKYSRTMDFIKKHYKYLTD